MKKSIAAAGYWLAYHYLKEHLKTQADDMARKYKKQVTDSEFQIALISNQWQVTSIRTTPGAATNDTRKSAISLEPEQ